MKKFFPQRSLMVEDKAPEVRQKILQDVHLMLKKGDFLYILGECGAGKTTLLNIIAGKLQPALGSVSLFGHGLSQASPAVLAAIRRSIAIVPQNIQLIPDLTVFDNIALAVTFTKTSYLDKKIVYQIQELLKKLQLHHVIEKRAYQLSGGEAQRVAIARALIRSPDLIIADEPTGHQDRESIWLVVDMFLKANAAGATVVLASHDREMIRRVRKKTAILRSGQMHMEEALCIY